MTIIDAHAHIYPDAVAPKAAAAISEFYDIPMCGDGKLSTLLQRGDEAGISHVLVHGVATTWHRVENINTYLMRTVAENPGRLTGFGTIHPHHPNIRAELERIKAGGLLGVKFHPDFQEVHIDDPKAIAFFEELADLHMPLISHMGDYRHPYSQPARMARALAAVPKLKVICAHFAGWSVWDEGWKALAGHPQVWIDASSSLYDLTPEKATELMHRFGMDRVFFGSDYPMWDPVVEVERFLALPLSEEERENVFHRNLETFLRSFGWKG